MIHPAMDSSFSIVLFNHSTGRYFSLFLVKPKVGLTRETLYQMTFQLHGYLHHLITHSMQEGNKIDDDETFCQSMYPLVIHTMNQLASFFGEDATVELDANLEFYGSESMTYLYQCRMELYLGACLPSPNLVDRNHVSYIFHPLSIEHIDYAEYMLRQARFMA